ncbi:acid protease [Suillus decipiens]|nr:acid protease [Suillus decipiens]
MFPAALLTLLLVFSITGLLVKAGNSPITVPLTSKLNLSNGTNNLLVRDRAHVKAHRDSSMRGQRLTDVPVTSDFTGYTISVGIGNPPKTYKLIIDSGSGNTWVGASLSNPYVETSPSFCTGEHVGVAYGTASFHGIEYLDYVTVGPGLTVILQSIGVASESNGFDGVDGVLGIGPVALTLDTLRDLLTEPIPTVTDSLYGQGTIPEDVLGIFFRPYGGSEEATGGQITFGGTDPTKCTGNIGYIPITNTSPSRNYWGIDLRIIYGTTVILELTDGIVDCGTNFIFIATDAYVRYRTATGGKYDPGTTLLAISEDQYGALRDLEFHSIDGQTYRLTPNAQIWPRSLNTRIGGQAPSIYLVVCDIGTERGVGPYDFYISHVFMQRFYTVLDTTNSRVGFATTEFTYATTN